MRKFFIFIFISLLLLASQLNGFAMMTKNFDGRYSVYTEGSEVNEEYTLTAFQAILAGAKNGDVNGESVRFVGKDEDIDKIIDKLSIKVVSEQNLSNIRTIYGYSPRLSGYVKIDGEKVNIQISKRGANITIGTPLILGSY